MKMRRIVLWSLLGLALLAAAGNILRPDLMPWNQRRERTMAGRPLTPLNFDGVPETARAGQVYTLAIHLGFVEMKRAGFTLSAEGCDGMIGHLKSDDKDVSISGTTVKTPEAGIALPAGQTSITWYVDWIAPDTVPVACTVSFSLHARATRDTTASDNDVIFGQRRFSQLAVSG